MEEILLGTLMLLSDKRDLPIFEVATLIARLISRYWPFANGSGRILDRFANNIDLGEGEIEARTSDGFRMQVYAEDLVGRHIAMSGKFDRSIVQILLDQARPGDTLLDIGANIGYVSAVFLTKVQDSSAVCIEPQPGVVDLLRKNMMQFGGRADVIEIGLADRDGSLRFKMNYDNRGGSRFSDDGDIEIPVRRADTVLATLNRVDLVKIDVEGFEEPIFRIAEAQLARLAPRAILFEDQTGAAAPDGAIGAKLTRLGYDIFGINKRLLRTNLVKVKLRSDCRFNDYIALR